MEDGEKASKEECQIEGEEGGMEGEWGSLTVAVACLRLLLQP